LIELLNPFVKTTKINAMTKQPRELQKLKEKVFGDFIKDKVEEKKESLGGNPTKKAIAIALAEDFGLVDYSGLYRLIYKLDF